VEAAQAGVQQAEDGLQAAQEARKRTLVLAQEEINAVDAALVQAKAGVAGAKSALDSMRLTSPLAGVVTALEARVGETAQPGMPQATVTSLTGLRIEALVSARQLPRLNVGQSARVTVDTQPGRTFPVVLSEIASAAEPDGRSFRVRFRFANAGVSLRPGQTARIQMPAG
jgi:RND family efflux transporter MFP subunit